MYASHSTMERVKADVSSFTDPRCYDNVSVSIRPGIENEYRIEILARKNEDMDEVALTVSRLLLETLGDRISEAMTDLEERENASALAEDVEV